jgi:hypothetical protein
VRPVRGSFTIRRNTAFAGLITRKSFGIPATIALSDAAIRLLLWNGAIDIMLNKRRKEKPDEIFVQDGCQVRVYYAPKVQRALRRKKRRA